MFRHITIAAAASMLVVLACSGRDHIFGHRIIEARFRFVMATTSEPVANAEIEYAVEEDLLRHVPRPEGGVAHDGMVVVSRRTDAHGEAVLPVIFRYKWELDDGGLKVEETAIDAPEGTIRVLLEGEWTECAFPHLKQAGPVRLEWIEGREAPKSKQPDQPANRMRAPAS